MPYKDPERQKEHAKQYYIKNKKKLLKDSNEYYIENKEKILKQKKDILNDPRRTKYLRIKNWKARGLIGDYEMIYRIYLSTKFCDECGFELNTGDNRMKKCMDHCHTSGLFRNILCNTCNVKRRY